MSKAIGLGEAATVKARARGLLRSAKGLLSDKALPKAVRDALEGLQAALGKTWKDLEAEAGDEQTAKAEAQAGAELEDHREAGLAEAEYSFSQTGELVRQAIKAKLTQPGDSRAPYVWLKDIYDTWAVYEMESSDGSLGLYKISYVIDDAGTVTLGDPTKVLATTVYVPVSEALAAARTSAVAQESSAASLEIAGEVIPLVEKAVRKDGTVPLKFIAPGWGSSGYYKPEVLKRDGPKVFSKGLKMYWDHPTPTEEAERPERSLRDLAAEFVSDATWQENGPDGPGLYADAKVFGSYAEAVDELAPHIGVSIRALGTAKVGEAEGRKGPIIEKIVAAKSVDFVTTPGAGGQVLQLFEAARGGAHAAAQGGQSEEGTEVDEKEAQTLRETNERLTRDMARITEAMLLSEAKGFVQETLAGIEMPALTRTRLADELAGSPVVKEGRLDREAYRARIQEAAKEELAYLASVTGSGRITGMGGGSGRTDTAKIEESQQSLEASFRALGLSESAAKAAAAGR